MLLQLSSKCVTHVRYKYMLSVNKVAWLFFSRGCYYGLVFDQLPFSSGLAPIIILHAIN